MKDYMRGCCKDKRYANRGQSLEQFIRFANDQYKRDGIAVVTKIPTEFLPIRNAYGQVVSCKVVEKSSVDFIGRVGSMPLAGEAKETKQDNIRFDAVQDHQAAFLDAYEGENEAICVVVVAFNLKTFYVVPWRFWKAGREAWKQAQSYGKRTADKITIEYNGETWTTTGKASVKESELLDEWRVDTGGRYGLDYLRRYIKSGTMA